MASSGNFCTLNPLTQPNSGTFSEGNLLFTHTSSAWRTTAGTHGMRTGKWYWEAYQYESLSGNGFPVGISDIDNGTFVATQASDYPDGSDARGGPAFSAYSNSGSNASKFHNGSETNLSFSIGVSGDVWQCALDLDNGKIWFGKNNSWDNSGDPANGSSPSYSGGQLSDSTTRTWVPITCSYNDSSSENFPQNFGQDSTFAGRITAGGNADENGFGDFKYAPPTGFLALCSANLPISADIDPAQTDTDYPSKQFNAITYDSTGSGQSITGVGFQPDLVWIKCRSDAQGNGLFDSTRGTSEVLESNGTNAENTSSGLTSFDSDGYSMGTYYNQSGRQYVSWCWRANGGVTSSNTDGSITSTVQANTKGGFSIVTTSGTGSNGTIGHGLGAVPKLIFTKRRSGSTSWVTYHPNQGSGGTGGELGYMHLDATQAFSDLNTIWNDTAPTSDVFSVGTATNVNASGSTYVHYCWAEIEGYSKFGRYVGNYNTDGTFIYTGFRPRMLFVKRSDAANSWFVWDTARTTFNKMNSYLYWDLSNAEETGYAIDVLSNGFKLRGQNNATNNSGGTFVYGAWGDVPFKYNNTF
jgi:hypothetical protein